MNAKNTQEAQEKQTTQPDTLGEKEEALRINDLLNHWLLSAPKFIIRAYHNDTMIHHVMRDCAINETTREEMQWRICKALLKRANKCREIVIKMKA